MRQAEWVERPAKPEFSRTDERPIWALLAQCSDRIDPGATITTGFLTRATTTAGN